MCLSQVTGIGAESENRDATSSESPAAEFELVGRNRRFNSYKRTKCIVNFGKLTKKYRNI